MFFLPPDKVLPERPDQQADGPDVRAAGHLPGAPPPEDRRVHPHNSQVHWRTLYPTVLWIQIH